jgi:hypothetical protein
MPLALVYSITLARSAKWEAEHSGTLRVIPPGNIASLSDDLVFAHGYSLGVEAIRHLDPEVGRMIVEPNGKPVRRPFDQATHDSPPAFEKDGWQVFIEWEA